MNSQNFTKIPKIAIIKGVPQVREDFVRDTKPIGLYLTKFICLITKEIKDNILKYKYTFVFVV